MDRNLSVSPQQRFFMNSSLYHQKSLEKILANSNCTLYVMDTKILTKEQYRNIVKTKRREFIHTHFEKELKSIFDRLHDDANKMLNCHHEVTFECPDHFDVDVIEIRLREYFRDIGYETVAEPRKDETRNITLTLT